MIRLISRSYPLFVAIMMFLAFMGSMPSIAIEQETKSDESDFVIRRS